MPDLSPIESLPQELFSEIVRLAPESIDDLQVTSSTIKHRTDQIINEPLGFSFIRSICIEKHAGENCDTRIKIELPALFSRWFELRLRSNSYKARKERFVGSTNVIYHIYVDAKRDKEKVVEWLAGRFGKRIYWVTIENWKDSLSRETATSLLEGVFCAGLTVSMYTLDHDSAERLISFTEETRTDELRLNVSQLHEFNHAEFLDDLSRHVSTMHINNLRAETVAFLAPHMISMFSNKLNNLNVCLFDTLPRMLIELFKTGLLVLDIPISFVITGQRSSSQVNDRQYIFNRHQVFITSTELRIKPIS